jgi:hypothetical membrane protein
MKHYLSRFSGIMAIISLWLTVLYGMQRIGLSFFDNRPLSYLGVAPATQAIFTTGLVVAALLIIIFGYYLKSNYPTSKAFWYLLVGGQIAQVITALTPDRGVTQAIHTIAAFTIVFSLPLLMWQFAKSQPMGKFRRWCYRLFYLEVASFIIGIGLFTLTRGVAPLGEMLPALAFHAWIVFLVLWHDPSIVTNQSAAS